jgi:hypothetical protein
LPQMPSRFREARRIAANIAKLPPGVNYLFGFLGRETR